MSSVMFSLIGAIISSVLFGILITLIVQWYFLQKLFYSEKPKKVPALPIPSFHLPDVVLQKLHGKGSEIPSEGCVPLNVLFQFLFHELRDTERVRKWFRNKLTVEFEEILNRSAIGKMFSSIKVRDICLGSEFPVINDITIQDVVINEQFSHIDLLSLKLDLSYNGGFQLIVDASMMLGKVANLSIKVGSLHGEARLEFTRMPYTHWSFAFYEDPHVQLDVESQFQGRPMPQITTLISSQIRKAIRKKHTLPNYKLRYKPFFTVAEDSLVTDNSSNKCSCLKINIHRISRLPTSHKLIYCLVGVDSIPWVDILTSGYSSNYLLDVTITKKHGQPLGITFKQENRQDKSRGVVVVDECSQRELLAGDIVVSIDGRKVSNVGQVPKLIRAAAVEATLRVERTAADWISKQFKSSRDQPATDDDNSGSSLSGSPSRSTHDTEIKTEVRKRRRIGRQSSTSTPQKSSFEPPRLISTKTVQNNRIIVMDELLTLGVTNNDNYLNIAVRGVDEDSKTDALISYLNIPLSKLLRSSDLLHCCQFKPPDSFAASNSKTHPLSAHNGFIPLLSYGDIVLTVEATGVQSRVSGSQSDGHPDPEISTPVHSQPTSRHKFVRTHLQSSTQCQFCGKKIWFKDAEKCQACLMTCHKKCVAKCTSGTVCSSSPTQVSESDGKHLMPDIKADTQRRNSANPEIVTMEVTPPTPTSKSASFQSGTRRGLSGLIASVASAGRGLKRAGSAHNLQLPDEEGAGDMTCASLPPSPQLSPSPSRKPSLPLELSEDISSLLKTLLEHGTDQGDMMCFAKATGKTLYEQLELPQRKEKIQEMMGKLQTAIDREADVRNLMEKQSSHDAAGNTKTAFLIGKSDERTQALTVLMLHFCAGLQHIQDLEEQEFDSGMFRFAAMRAKEYDHFRPTPINGIYAFCIIGVPVLFFGWLMMSDRWEKERSYRNGEVSYADRKFKLI